MTNDELLRAVTNSPYACPHCDGGDCESTDEESTGPTVVDATASWVMRCPTCEAEWEEEYVLFKITPIKAPRLEPEEGDLITYDGLNFFEVGDHSCFEVKLGRKIKVTVEEGEDRAIVLSRYMTRQGHWPNVWSCDDHGGLTLI